MIFFNSALMACAIIRLKGGNPTVGDGFRAAMNRLPQIACWALVSATVGFILKLIESRSEKIGQIVAGLLGMAWSITTYYYSACLRFLKRLRSSFLLLCSWQCFAIWLRAIRHWLHSTSTAEVQPLVSSRCLSMLRTSGTVRPRCFFSQPLFL
ncbi:DUF6159 family protein [uncultured Gimesia sp.]|uniref:DUF6159 family protein n=1 Tax=uncultured Gimesia sp. TaxID=1678688 RepID=UPI0026355CD5|nr:DUF6159 family protein [uncultured Gimesia sp.]